MSHKKSELKLHSTMFVICLVAGFLGGFISNMMYAPCTTISQSQTVTVGSEKEKIDINHASKAELESLPFIGEKLADEIIKSRPYESIWELKKIDGIGDETIRRLESEVSVK